MNKLNALDDLKYAVLSNIHHCSNWDLLKTIDNHDLSIAYGMWHAIPKRHKIKKYKQANVICNFANEIIDSIHSN